MKENYNFRGLDAMIKTWVQSKERRQSTPKKKKGMGLEKERAGYVETWFRAGFDGHA